MISSFEDIAALLEELDASLRSEIRLFMIGGGALLHRGMRQATKDIDVIVRTADEYRECERALKMRGFIAKFPSRSYERMNLNAILVRGDFRIDLFNESVLGAFSLSAAMAKRSERVLSLERLSLSLCSDEDIFLFKAMTEREGDLEDCIALAKRGLRWGLIIDELKSQVKRSGSDIWITWVGERLDLLQERGVNIPFMRELDALREEWYNRMG